MSSFVRRIERQQVATRAIFPLFDKHGKVSRLISHPAREKFYLGRGKMLGVTNPKAKDLIARQRREKSRKARKDAR